MSHTRLNMTFNSARVREVMGVLIVDSGTKSTVDKVAPVLTPMAGIEPVSTLDEKERIVAKMAIEPAPRKSGMLDMKGDAPASDGRRIGPPDAKITSGKIGVGGAILIGVAVLTVIMILSKGRST